MEGKINICVLDFSPEDLEILKQKGFSIYNGSAGTKIEISYSNGSTSKYCLPNFDYPTNLHEYDILITNLIHNEVIPYRFEDHRRKNVMTEGETKLEVNYPTNIFDPRPLSLNFLNPEIQEFAKKQGLLIVFADKEYEIVYRTVHIKKGGYTADLEKNQYSNYSFFEVSTGVPKHGMKSNILIKSGELKKIFEEFSDLEYHQTFSEHKIWNDEHKLIPDPNYVPLLENHSGEVISYAYFYKNLVLYVFPDIKRKGEFTSRFLTEVAPQILPALFSYSSKFDWLKHEDYWFPKHHSFIEQKKLEKGRHEKELAKIEEAILKNNKQYQFLHELIFETDEKLVDAVIKLLNWLEFENVTKVDEQKEEGTLEEDIQIQVSEKLLVVEVKGIGGTSKDNECSQISKVRLRRMKERKSTEVYGLYIVNHERYKPPLQRTNPPFNATQIQDAINDDRGLLSTWELFKIYYDIENGIFSKDEVREKFFQYGLVDFKSEFEIIGKVDKTFKNGSIGSIELSGIEISVGDILYSEKNGRLKMHKILSMEQNKTSINSTVEGRTGISFDIQVLNNSMLYKKKKASTIKG